VILDGEVEAEELADPLVLRDGGEVLVQQELEAVVVHTHMERPTPKVRSPVAHRLDQPDKLALVCHELVMASGEGAAEEGQRPSPWWRTAPKPMPEASQSTMNGMSKSGIWRTGPVVRARLRAANAVVASSSQEKASHRRRRVSGAAMRPKSQMYFR
jgi:hypothetical protein